MTSRGLRWIALLQLLAAFAVAFLVFRSEQVCSGEPPHCVELNPNIALPRALIILASVVVGIVLVTLAGLNGGRRRARNA